MKIFRILNTAPFLIGLLIVGFAVDLILIGRAYGLTKNDWPGWVQAVGSIIAIVAAFFFGERQATKAIDAIRTADQLVAERKMECIIGISDACSNFVAEHRPNIHDGGFSFLAFAIHDLDVDIKHLVSALDAIPIHEIGSFEAVSNFMQLKKSTSYLQRALERAWTFAQTEEARQGSDWVAFDTSFMQINCDLITQHAALLRQALKLQIAG